MEIIFNMGFVLFAKYYTLHTSVAGCYMAWQKMIPYYHSSTTSFRSFYHEEAEEYVASLKRLR